MSKELIQELNIQVSSWSVMYATLHTKFEELYNEAALHMDEIAERILTLGGNPVGTLKQHLEQSVVKEAGGQEQAEEMVETIANDYGEMMKSLKKGMELAEQTGDDRTEDVLNATYQTIEKHQWMLHAFLGAGNK